jgi:putative FmdB family regulatory protein
LNDCTNPSQVPTYEFTCPKGHDFDKFFRSMASAPTVVPCPVCGEQAERQMSAGAGLVFHGSGFYITDYGKDGKKDQKAAASRDAESKKDSPSETASGSGSSDAGASSSAPTESKADAGSSGSSGDAKSAKSAKSSESAPAAAAPATGKNPPKASE